MVLTYLILHCLRVLITQTSTELCILSNPQSNNHVVTGTLNQEDQGVSSQTWHYRNLRLGFIHSYMVVVWVDIFKQTFSRDTATAELCQFQFSFSCYFLTILSKSLSYLRGGHGCVRGLVQHVACPLWDLSPRGLCDRGPVPPSPFPQVREHALRISHSDSFDPSALNPGHIMNNWSTGPMYILHMHHLSDIHWKNPELCVF